MHFCRRSPRCLRRVNARRQLALYDFVTKLNQGLEQSVLTGIAKRLPGFCRQHAGFHSRLFIGADRACPHADMAQHAAHTGLTIAQTFRRDLAGAAHFGGERHDATGRSRRHIGSAAALARREEKAVGRAKHPTEFDNFLLHCFAHLGGAQDHSWQIHQRAAAGMKIEGIIGERHQHRLHVMGEH